MPRVCTARTRRISRAPSKSSRPRRPTRRARNGSGHLQRGQHVVAAHEPGHRPPLSAGGRLAPLTRLRRQMTGPRSAARRTVRSRRRGTGRGARRRPRASRLPARAGARTDRQGHGVPAGGRGGGAVDPAELRRLVDTGRVTDLPAVGPSTGGVVADAVQGRPSAYLADLERSSEIPSATGRSFGRPCRATATRTRPGRTAGLRSRRWRGGPGPRPRLAGHDRPLAPHERGERPHARAPRAPAARRSPQLNERLAPFRVLSGMEVDINEDGSLDAPDELLARLDLVVASPHIKLRMDRAAMTRRLVLAVANPHVDVLGHVTGRKVGWAGARVRPAADFDPDDRVRRLRPLRGRRRGELPPRAPGPAGGAAGAGPRVGVPGGGRHRRPRLRPARMAGIRLRQARPARRRAGPDHQRGVGGRPAGLGPPPASNG